ncbi:MAG: hypothetical protein NZO58_13065, partial [Gemmataceae bacterium]|nr:hypothetical protein [Gemmataceae bacterium]
MGGARNVRKILIFGLLGALGCLSGWAVGELFLLAALPTNTDAGGSLATRPELPALTGSEPMPTPPAPRLPTEMSVTRTAAPPAPPPVLAVRTTNAAAPPAPPPPELRAGRAPTPVPPPPEFAQRLNQAGGKSGDVQLTLIWYNGNDLDLHCVEPSGEEIFFARRRSRSGGELDVDMNAS